MSPYSDVSTPLLLLWLSLSIVFVGLSAESLTHGALGIKRKLRLNAFFIGATLMALATSMPEWAISLLAAARGSPELALGNLIGSNLGNIGLILGLAALITPIAVDASRIRFELPLLFGVSLLFLLMSLDNFSWSFSGISRLEGLILLVLLSFYLWFLFRSNRKDADSEKELQGAQSTFWCWFWVGLGVVFLGFSSDAFLKSALTLSERFGIRSGFIGLTLVAIGTSLPELATTLAACRRREHGLIIGNLIGSNLMNILLVAGSAAAIYSLPLESGYLWAPLLATVVLAAWLCLRLALAPRRQLSKIDGILWILFYLGAIGLA